MHRNRRANTAVVLLGNHPIRPLDKRYKDGRIAKLCLVLAQISFCDAASEKKGNDANCVRKVRRDIVSSPG